MQHQQLMFCYQFEFFTSLLNQFGYLFCLHLWLPIFEGKKSLGFYAQALTIYFLKHFIISHCCGHR
jgi:hypothetical protein